MGDVRDLISEIPNLCNSQAAVATYHVCFFLLISIVFCQMCSFRVHCCDAVAYHHSVLCLVW